HRHTAARLPRVAGSRAHDVRDLHGREPAHRPLLRAARPERGVRMNRLTRRLLRHRLILGGGAIVILFALLAAVGSRLAPYDPNMMDFTARFASPSIAHPFGTDEFGRDIFSRVLHGAAVSFRVAFIAVGISASVGVLLGMLAGYVGRWLDELIMRFMDVLFAFPAVLLAITVMAILG